ncbi:Vacuolar protein-sorting-associated protein 33 [Pleosporales sp. CAS-2024a]
MADAVPGQLKRLQLAPFAKRAAQLEKFKPIITYWLRFHMVQKIIAAGLHSADQECTAYTTELMEHLEQTKAQNPGEDALLDDVAASAYCEQFALQTFAKGDRDMAEDKATSNTVDTLLAASTFLELLSVWKKDDAEITAKTKFAKYHALRILKAIKAGEDPNLSNPVRETPRELASPPALDPNDPEVQSIQQASQAPRKNPYQPYVETAPNTNPQPSPTISAPQVSPPIHLPSAPVDYTNTSHNDVSPMSQPASSRRASAASISGDYFPRMDPPTFTAEDTAPSLPTVTSLHNEGDILGLGQSTLPTDSSLPRAPQAPDLASFYTDTASPPPAPQPPQHAPSPQTSLPAVSPPSTYRSPPGVNPYATPSPQVPRALQAPQLPPPTPATAPSARGLQTNPYAQSPSAPPPTSSQGPFRDDERSIAEAQKHAKWAISALNFDDAATAVKELRIALRALGAN